MSVLAQFGPKSFQLAQGKVNTFEGLALSNSLSTEKKEVTGKKPATSIKGPGLTQIKLTAQLWATLGVDPQAEVEEWMALQEASVPYPFILGATALGPNKYLLTRCDANYTAIDGEGAPLAVKLSLTFEEYLPPGGRWGQYLAPVVAVQWGYLHPTATRWPDTLPMKRRQASGQAI